MDVLQLRESFDNVAAVQTTTSAADAAATAPGVAYDGPDEEIRRYYRSPVDVLRMVLCLVVALFFMAITDLADNAILAFEEDVVRLFDFLSPSIERIIAGGTFWVTLVIVLGAYVFPLATRRYRLLGYLLAASAVAGLLTAGAERLLGRSEADVVVNEIAARAGVVTFLDTSVTSVAQLIAIFVVLAPFVSRRWRRAGIFIAAATFLVRLLVAYHLPSGLVIAYPFGAAAGAATLFAFGRPDRRPTPHGIRNALAAAGIDTIDVVAAKVDARGSTPYFATTIDGTRLFVKVLGESERAADLLFRFYRFLRLKNVGDNRPFSSLRRTVEHEALVALMARDLGIPTPRLRAVAQIGSDSMLLAYDAIDGTSVDGLPDEAVTDQLMRGVWSEVKVLHEHRIAHRDLRRANVFVSDDGAPFLIDFGFSELAVSDAIMNADVAQLLASFAVVASPERTVRAAIEVMGRDAIATALPRLQMNALSGATQTALKARRGLLPELQQEVMRLTGVGELRFEQIQRVNGKTLAMFGVLAGAIYLLLPQFADLPAIVGQVKDADWSWALLVALASALTYVGATASFAGAIPDPLPTGPLLAAQVGSSFASKLAPAGLGGMALNVRFLQKHGVDEPVAVSGVGLNLVMGFVGHFSLMGVFFIWAGREAFGSFRLPDPRWFLIGIAAALALVGLGLLIPPSRRIMVGTIWPLLRKSVDGVGDVMRSPLKFGLILGGSILVTSSYLLALYASTQAFGGGLPLATVGAVYLIGALVASAAPTPGGLGAMEAALIAGLVGSGMDNAVAVPTVFLFRLATFWLPIIPGWLCFQWLQRNDHL